MSCRMASTRLGKRRSERKSSIRSKSERGIKSET